MDTPNSDSDLAPGTGTPTDDAGAEALLLELVELRAAVLAGGAEWLQRLGQQDAAGPSVTNLAHYLALRRLDLRPMQRRLMWRGLTSLGRLESRVLPGLDAAIVALSARAGLRSSVVAPKEHEFFAGEARLVQTSDALFGLPPSGRRSRIMVTLPTEAATDAAFVRDLVQRGMDVARINCAHDDSAAWKAMAANVRAAGEAVGRPIKVLMDIAGPKIRTEQVKTPGHGARLKAGDLFALQAEGLAHHTRKAEFAAVASLPEIVDRLLVGDRVLYNDGKMEGVVERVKPGEALIRVRRTQGEGTKLRPEKGLNVPDTPLGLSPLTVKDETDLAAVIECADIIGYSFVSRPEDIDLLEEALAKFGQREKPLGLVAKIERPEAVKNLPALIAHTAVRRPFGVMIARGDLAAELGFERLAEMQEEILWLCEAAGVPAIWATQVLEDLVKTGVPSRGEMTDAAMAARAECVMLNKGPAAGVAVGVLDRLLARMDAHQFKKTPILRALRSW